MADGRDHRRTHCFLVQGSPCGSPAYSPTATNGCVRRNQLRFFGRTTREYLPDKFRHSHGESLILLVAILLSSFTIGMAFASVGQALLLSLLQGSFFHQYALSLVSFTCPAEAHHDRRQRTVLASPPRQGRVSAMQIHQVIEIGTAQAERSFTFHEQEFAGQQILATVGALGVAQDVKHDEVLRFTWWVLVGRWLRLHCITKLLFCGPRQEESRPRLQNEIGVGLLVPSVRAF